MIRHIVADLGGTFLRCAVVNEHETVAELERIRLVGDATTRGTHIWLDIIEAVAEYIEQRIHMLDPASPIIFAFPGPLTDGVTTSLAPTVLGGDELTPDIRAMLATRTGREVLFINDVSAAAWYFGQRLEADRFAVVTVSSGIGLKIFDRRHPLRVLDDAPFAGEIGHLIVSDDPAAPVCDCGGRGHLGGIASARGFERYARSVAASDAAFNRSFCATRFGATPLTLTNEVHLVPALRDGDRWSTALLTEASRPLVAVLRTVCVANGLDGLAIMGGFAQALGETYRAMIADGVGALSDRGPARATLRCGIAIASADEEPSLVGASMYARADRFVT